jgi:translation initiation factor IF-3
MNDDISASQVLLIGDDGTDRGVLSLREAHSIAHETGFDLVEVAANADPPVCRLMHFEAWMAEQDECRGRRRPGADA